MSEFFFVVKTFILATLLIALMQIRIGNRTIERHALRWIRESSAVESLRSVARGAVAVGERGWRAGSEMMSSAKNATVDRAEKSAASSGLSWEVRRSDEYYKQQEKKRQANEKRAKEEGPTGDEID